MLPRPTVAASASPVLGVAHSRASETKVCPALQLCDMCANSALFLVKAAWVECLHRRSPRRARRRCQVGLAQTRGKREPGARGTSARATAAASAEVLSAIFFVFSDKCKPRFPEMIRTLRPRLCPTFHAGRICEPGRPTPRILALSSGSGPRQERAPGLGTWRAACRCPRGEPAFLARGQSLYWSYSNVWRRSF